MQTRFTVNYIKIYAFQLVSVLLNILSLFVVIPKLSSTPDIYGIYVICINAMIFFSYADLGFMNAGQKYLGAAFATGKKEMETRIVGFLAFLLLLFLAFFVILVLLFSYKPSIVFSGLTINSSDIASQLFLVLAFSCPVVIVQRLLQIIFSVRLKDYILQVFLIIASVLKIVSVPFFIGNGEYNIVQYFAFCQIALLFVLIIAAAFAFRSFQISFLFLLKSIRFDREIFGLMKNLAFSSLAVTISWIIYYELDIYAVARLFDPKIVALYSVAATLLSFSRSLFGVIFNPFNARFSHFVALHNIKELKQFFLNVVCITAPLTCFTIVIMICNMKFFIVAWLGPDYVPAIPMAQFLIAINLLTFIISPSSILLTVLEKVRQLYRMSFLLPVVFWGGITLFIQNWGVNAFPFFKLVATLINAIFLVSIVKKLLQETWFAFISRIFLPLVVPVGIIITVSLLLPVTMTGAKSRIDFLKVLLIDGLLFVMASFIYYFTSNTFRSYLHRVIYRSK